MLLSTTFRIFDISNWLLNILQVTFDDDVSYSFTWASGWLPLVCIFDLRLTLSVKLTNLKQLSTLLHLSLSYLFELLSIFFFLLSWRLLTIFWPLLTIRSLSTSKSLGNDDIYNFSNSLFNDKTTFWDSLSNNFKTEFHCSIKSGVIHRMYFCKYTKCIFKLS